MAERLARDPNLDACPDFSSEPFAPMRALLQGTGLTEEEAVTSLKDAWTEHNRQLRERWDREAEDRQAGADGAPQGQPAEGEQQQLQPEELPALQQEVDEERPEREKKTKAKLRAFNPDLSVASVLAPRPSSYALNKLANFEYCELWYFTQEGCEDAQRTHRTEADDSFGMSKMGELVTFRPVASVQASKRALQDESLTWEQFHYAHRSFVKHVLKSGWPDEHTQALVRFFIELENSPYIDREHGKRVVLTYQARVRRSWMDSMKDSDEAVFNIALINNDLMESISREILGSVTADLNRQLTITFLLSSSTRPPLPLLSATPATPAAPTTSLNHATPATPAAPATSVRHATPATPAAPATSPCLAKPAALGSPPTSPHHATPTEPTPNPLSPPPPPSLSPATPATPTAPTTPLHHPTPITPDAPATPATSATFASSATLAAPTFPVSSGPSCLTNTSLAVQTCYFATDTCYLHPCYNHLRSTLVMTPSPPPLS
ncbi:hypothetical protein LshimejAT787_0706300 [Lyophyllum shimeji]|uniref:Uncharacterized protein n=1 Tax=Lyophyllum shimeji TaxID=47721 RepID=A0A9P3UQF4_LYOSH|nr:hypothetical protein LshimejAT787_0706300 [Lyophyllum shimeji]